MPTWLTTGQPQVNASPLLPSRKRPAPRDFDPPKRSSKPTQNPPSSSASPNLPCVTAAPSGPQPPLSVAVQNASNPASPALPNVVASQISRASSTTENNILPSPAPSEDPAMHPSTSSKEPAGNRVRATSIVSLGDEEEEEEEESRTDNRLDIGEAPANSRSVSLASAENNTRTSLPAVMPASLEQENTPRDEGFRRPSAPGPGSLQSPGGNASTGYVRSPYTPAAAPPDAEPSAALPRASTSCLAPEFCLQRLQSLPAFSADGRGLSAVESVRVDLIREAVERGDHDYIYFHQLMCMKAISSPRLPAEVAMQHAALTSLDLLNHLVQTSEVSMQWLQWFGDFPVPKQEMQRQWPEEYSQQISRCTEFISRAAVGGWEKLQKHCIDTKLPPTAVEIEEKLGVYSPIFQSIFHRAILRRLCNFPEPNTTPQNEFFASAERVFRHHQHRLAELRSQPMTIEESKKREQGEERYYLERITDLRMQFVSQVEQQPTLQARRMSHQTQNQHMQLSNSPVQLPSQMHSPAVSSPLATVAHQSPMQTAQQQIVPAQQMSQPQLQVAIPPGRPGRSMSSYGVMTPTSTLQSPHLVSSVQNMNQQNFHQNQQPLQQQLLNSAQAGASVNGFNVVPHGHGPALHNRPSVQPQSPMTPQYSPTVIQSMNGQMVRPGMPAGGYPQQVYQQGPSLQNDSQNNYRHIQAQQMQIQAQAQHIRAQQMQQQMHAQQVPTQQVLRSNASSPSMTMMQATRHAAHQVDPRQINGTAGSPAQVQTQLSRPIIPPSNHVWIPQVIDPSQSALHQARSSSPVLEATPQPRLGRKLFQSVNAFAIPPSRLEDGKAQQKFAFAISPEDHENLPSQSVPSPFEMATRKIAENSKIYRVRCARSASTEEHNWILQDTYWPAGMFLNLNGNVLEMRKKLQHGKDLPIDITPYIRPGENQLEINLLRRPNEEKISNFAIAVEIVGMCHRDRIKAECFSKRLIPAEEILDSIKTGLSRSTDDDDIAIVDSTVTITLVDPYTTCKPCDIPVRGRWCLHRDCFDLDIFLNTRPRRQPHSPSVVDEWKCPRCRNDARPQNLVVDGFLMQVIKELSALGLSDTRAIIVDSDGNWKHKPEDKQDDARASQGRTSHSSTPVDSKRARVPSTPAAQDPPPTSEVIELD